MIDYIVSFSTIYYLGYEVAIFTLYIQLTASMSSEAFQAYRLILAHFYKFKINFRFKYKVIEV